VRWRITPAFSYGAVRPRVERRGRIPVATAGKDALAICSWGTGESLIDDDAIFGRFVAEESRPALMALCAAHQEPLVVPKREHVEARLDATTAYWRRWAAERTYDGPWRDDVIRSALALKLLFHAPSGAIAAAATTSLPEEIGGERNWDYRFCWVRDAAFTLDALLQLGCPSEAEAFFWWLLHASQLTRPRLQVLASTEASVRPSARWSCGATGARAPSGSATTPRRRPSSTSTAPCCRRRGSTRMPVGTSTATRAGGLPA
jgi:hypothetical protein